MEIVRVKLSSEAAGGISLTPVVARDMPVRELVGLMLAVTGKDPARIRELLLRGTLVIGASRFRWTGWEADSARLLAMLATFPDADPSRPFAAERCFLATLHGAGRVIELPKEIAARRGLLRRASFWGELMKAASTASPRYLDYSYKEQADCYRQDLTADASAAIRQAARLLRYSALEQQVRATAIDAVDLFVRRAEP